MQRDRQQAGRHLFPGRDDRVVFAGVVQRGQRLAPADELIGRAGHGGDDDSDLVAGLDLAFDALRDVADAVEVRHRRAAEFHHDTRHGVLGRCVMRGWIPDGGPGGNR